MNRVVKLDLNDTIGVSTYRRLNAKYMCFRQLNYRLPNLIDIVHGFVSVKCNDLQPVLSVLKIEISTRCILIKILKLDIDVSLIKRT